MSKCFCHFNGLEVKDAAARRLSEENAAGLEVATSRISNLVANPGNQTNGNSELLDIRVGGDGTVYPTAGDSVRGQITKLNKDEEITVTDISQYEEHRGTVTYEDEWWKIGSSEIYNYIVIPLTGDWDIISVTGGEFYTRLAAVKTFTEPTSNNTPIDFSEYWTKSVEVGAGKTLTTVLPPDANFLIVNTMYNNKSCISDFTFTNNIFSVIGKVENRTKGVRNQITVSAQNIRDFNTEGGLGDGCPDELVTTNLPLWKNHISKNLNTDFLCMDEWYPYFDKAKTIDAYQEIFKQFYPYKYELPVGAPVQVVMSKHDGVMFSLGDLARLNFYCPTIVCNIGGKSVAVVCWLESSEKEYTKRIESYNKVIPILDAFDIVILAGDFNTSDAEHFEDEMNVWRSAGYTIGNGGYWGKFNTWYDMQPLDNIVTKGVIFEDFEVCDKITSDHNGVKAITSFIG